MAPKLTIVQGILFEGWICLWLGKGLLRFLVALALRLVIVRGFRGCLFGSSRPA